MHRLDRLSTELGIDLWIKRDDLTGFAGGGNKGRKLEFLIAEALQEGVDAIVCQGAAQSNFVRQLGAACAMFGIECHAALMPLPYYAGAGPTAALDSGENGNLVLDRLFGVIVHTFPNDTWDVLESNAEAVAAELRRNGKKVKLIAIGGSSALGALSFELAGQEVDATQVAFDVVVSPSSSGSTHAGLAYHFAGSSTHVIGISADPDPDDVLATDIVELCAELDQLLGRSKRIERRHIDLRMEYCGDAYGVPSPEGNAAIELFARREGIVLDPVYTGKAAAGLLDLARRGEIGGTVLFWHTGGLPTLFAVSPFPISADRS